MFRGFVFRVPFGEEFLIAASARERQGFDPRPLSDAEARPVLEALAASHRSADANEGLREFWSLYGNGAHGYGMRRRTDQELLAGLLQERATLGRLEVFKRRRGGGAADPAAAGTGAGSSPVDLLVAKLMAKRSSLEYEGDRFRFATAPPREGDGGDGFKLVPAMEARALVARMAESKRIPAPERKALGEAVPLLAQAPGEAPKPAKLFLLRRARALESASPKLELPRVPKGKPAEKTDWVEVVVKDEDGNPYMGPVEIALPDGRIVTTLPDENGKIHMDGLKPGQCQVSLPELDAPAWK